MGAGLGCGRQKKAVDVRNEQMERSERTTAVVKLQALVRGYRARKQMPFLQLVGFRGVRTVNGVKIRDLPREEQDEVKQLTDRVPLLWAGHVSLSADRGKTIFGFQCVIPDGMSIEQVLQQLKEHKPLPGLVTDDTELFDIAREKSHEHGWNTDVFVNYKLVSEDRLTKMHNRLVELSQITDGSHGFMYCFPTQDPDPMTGMYFSDDRTGNCATFPQLAFGVDIPDKGGNLREFMPHVTKEAEATKWDKLRPASTGDLVESEKQQTRDLRHCLLHAAANAKHLELF